MFLPGGGGAGGFGLFVKRRLWLHASDRLEAVSKVHTLLQREELPLEGLNDTLASVQTSVPALKPALSAA